MIKLQQSQALTSHFERFWSIVHSFSPNTFIVPIPTVTFYRNLFWMKITKRIV